jgi:hypothetical protein
MDKAYIDFITRLKKLIEKNPSLIITTLSNIFTMRLLGNKTHGDLAEIGIAEFINQYMYDYRSVHVGKDLYRAKTREEDIKIINEITEEEFPVSLKAYGTGPLQLSTDKNNLMFPRLEKEINKIDNRNKINAIFKDPAFSTFAERNVLPLIYDESKKKCNILIFNYELAKNNTAQIERVEGGRRKYPIYRFNDSDGNYICEVRYGAAAANALQRGLWTHTKRGLKYFESVTGGWIDYSHNLVLVNLFSHALVSSQEGHKKALEIIKVNIEELKRKTDLFS